MADIKLRSAAGGSIALTVDPTLTTDETFDMTQAEAITSGGSEATGYWVKYPDGTMIQYGIKNYGSMPITGAWGALFTSGMQEKVFFPKTFISPPSCTMSAGGAGVSYFISLEGVTGTDGSQAPYFLRGTSGTVNSLNMSWQAIGRWR